MAEEILGYHPEGLTLLEMSFMLWGYQEGCCFYGFQETPAPFFRQAVSCGSSCQTSGWGKSTMQES